MNSHVYLRNTVSGVVEEFDAKTAERYLRLYPKTLVRVDSSKNEVLAEPYTVENGERKRLAEPVLPVQPEFEAESPKPKAAPKLKTEDS